MKFLEAGASTMTGLWHRMIVALVLLCVCLWGTTDAGVAKERDRLVRRQRKPAPTPIVIEQDAGAMPVDMSKVGTMYRHNDQVCLCYVVAFRI